MVAASNTRTDTLPYRIAARIAFPSWLKTAYEPPVQWKNGFSLADCRGKEIQLRFELRDAKLYSFSFNDSALSEKTLETDIH